MARGRGAAARVAREAARDGLARRHDELVDGDAHDGREGNGQAFEELTLWMRSAETIELVQRCLVSLGAGPSPTQRQDRSRIVLAILCLAIDANVR